MAALGGAAPLATPQLAYAQAPPRPQTPATTATPPATPPTAGAGQMPTPVDPELFRPLTPLDQFRPTAPTGAAAGAPAPTSVSYAVEVHGLETVGLEQSFRQLSALTAGHGQAASRLQINSRVEDDKALAGRLLRTAGFFQSAIEAVVRPDGAPGRFRVVITISPGPQFHFSSVSVRGPDTQPPGLARKALTLQPGDPILAQAVRAAEANVSLRLPQQGYPFVEVGDRDIALDATSATGAYTLPVSPGPKSSFGGFQLQEPVFTARHLGVIARFKPGDLYDSRKVEDLRRALLATSLFSAIGVSPVDTGRRAADGAEIADLRVTGKAAPSHTLAASLGYETGAGVTLEGGWSALNLFPPEGALTVHAIAGSQQQLLGVRFQRSNAGLRDRTILAEARISRETTEAYDANTGIVRASVARTSTPIWQKRWTYSAGVEASVSEEQSYSFALGRKDWRTYQVAGLRFSGGYDRSNSLLDPTRGFQVLASVDPEGVFGDGSHAFLKTTLEGRAYLPVTEALVLAGRVRAGALVGLDPQQLPPSRRFYEGGGGTIRGYGYQQVGPRAPDGSRLGGASSADMSLEARYRFGNFGVVAFVDGGQVYESATPRFSDLRYGVGLGARYYTNFGPIRLDVATPIARRSGESAVGVYISIGQAF